LRSSTSVVAFSVQYARFMHGELYIRSFETVSGFYDRIDLTYLQWWRSL
jgi:hypothetical protein